MNTWLIVNKEPRPYLLSETIGACAIVKDTGLKLRIIGALHESPKNGLDHICLDVIDPYIRIKVRSTANIVMVNLTDRQSRVLVIALKLIAQRRTTSVTYKDIKNYLGEDDRYCRGIGASCSAIYKRGYHNIVNLVVKQ